MTEPTINQYFETNYSTDAERRRYAQNSLIVDTAIAISKALEGADIAQKDLAARLDKTEGYISQVLSGGSNLTLRTLADVAYALDCMVDLTLKPLRASSAVFMASTSNTPAVWKMPPQQQTAAAESQYALAA